MGKIVGIDLGTTNSCVAVVEGDHVTVIHNQRGNRILPSVVAFTNEDCLVGESAKRQAVTNPTRTVHGIKRLMGRKADSERLVELKKTSPYQIVAAANGDAWIRIDNKEYGPQEISALILKEMKDYAQDYLGEEVTEAIVTVPAYFDDSQRQATRAAGKIAGLDVKKILNEPTAAALGYGAHKDKKNQVLAVFDLGGGTFDITILRFEDGVFEVLATNGDTFLGGDDFDQGLVRYLVKDFMDRHGTDLTKDPCALQRLRDACETAKKELSNAPVAAINLPFVSVGPAGPLHLQHDGLSRELFDQLTAPLVERLEIPCRTAMEDAHTKPEQIDQVLLVGGMTRVPAVQRKAEAIFGKKPSKGVNPDEIVAVGAATQGAIITGELSEVVLLDVTPHSLGIRVVEDEMSIVIPKNTTIPTSERKVFATTRDDQDFVNIEVYQGESKLVSQNTHLGRFTLGGLPRKPVGQVYVDVVFTIDADGVVHVTAKEMQSGKEASVTVSPSSGLTTRQLEEITQKHRPVVVREAGIHAP
ncbi:MAG: hypothetical protein A2289_07440 [Deltaproteobacteria bacterium RIFOXYA12_FULL_58_15]|nr:MAG: hypothetical protein A2289_07440 [Deltaproteobacteria bacterium RIFOXYA12_FULL_58_15]